MPTNYLVTEQELNAVADAIKAKNGTSGKLRWPTEMVSAIQNITTGVDTSDATVTANDLLSGVIAYGSDGTSITGSIPIRQSTDAFFEGMRYGPRNFNTMGYGQIHFSSGYYGGAHFPILNCSDYTITPSTSSQSITIFGSTATYEYFPRAITIEAMPVTDWSANGSINIDENKVLEGTYFYNSSGILQSGSITKSNLGILNLRPSQIILSESHLLTPVLRSGYYPFEHQIELINSTSSIITITPSATSQTITLLGSSATYDYFPYAITIESAITDWTGGGSINIDENKVLSNTYFYNSTGSLTSGNIISYTSYQILIRTLTSDYEWHPSWATQVSTGYGIQMPNSCKISAGYYPESFYVKPNYDSTPWEITASTTDKTYYLINTSDIYYHTQPNQPIGFNSEAFPTSIIVKSAITDWTGNGSVNITSDKVLSDTYFYNNSGSLTSGNIPIILSLTNTWFSSISPSNFDNDGYIQINQRYSRGYYNGSHAYHLASSTSSIITITPSTSSQTITLFGPSATYDYFPYAINIESAAAATTDWTGNGSINIEPSKVLSNTYFYNSSGNLISGNIPNISSTVVELMPQDFSMTGTRANQINYKFSPGYYSQSHYINFLIEPGDYYSPLFSDEKIILFGSSATYTYFPNSITIKSTTYWIDQRSTISGIYSNNTISKIDSGAFAYTSLTTASFPACKTIRTYAFYYCTSLTTINFPSCSYIGSYAFGVCSNLTTANFPSCSYIGGYAFSYCYKLTSASFPVCTEIGTSAFYYCSSLTTINFPSCTNIGAQAFYYCYKLTSASFPVCTEIENNAFAYCYSLTSASFPVCSKIGDSAFFNCKSLTTINFPVCSQIGNYAFRGCSSLTSVKFSACLSIGNYAFAGCNSLTSVSFPACLSIGYYAFSGCNSLTTAYFPNLPYVNTSMSFSGKEYLSNVTILGQSTSTIYTSAFKNCYRLRRLTILYSGGVAPLVATDAFTSTPISTFTSYTNGVYGSIFVPSSLVAAYKSATNWAIYSNRITSIPS